MIQAVIFDLDGTLLDRDSSLKIYQVSNINGNFTLRSGQQATEYFDKYLFEGQPKLLREVDNS